MIGLYCRAKNSKNVAPDFDKFIQKCRMKL